MTEPIKKMTGEALGAPSQLSSKNSLRSHLSWRVQGLAQNQGPGQDGSSCFHGLEVAETLAGLGERPRKGLMKALPCGPLVLVKQVGLVGLFPPSANQSRLWLQTASPVLLLLRV